MKTEIWIFHGLTIFFALVTAAYGFVTHNSSMGLEIVGFAALLLTTFMSLMIGVYLEITAKSIDSRPEDDLDGEIHELAGEQGFFAPYSWWPMPLAAGAALCFLALAIGMWIMWIGLVVAALALVGWVYEFYVGEHAH